MTKEKVRLSYRLTKELYDKILNSAKTKGVTVNTEINWILWEYYFSGTASRQDGRKCSYEQSCIE